MSKHVNSRLLAKSLPFLFKIMNWSLLSFNSSVVELIDHTWIDDDNSMLHYADFTSSHLNCETRLKCGMRVSGLSGT